MKKHKLIFIFFLLIIDVTILPVLASLPHLFVQQKEETISYIYQNKDYLQYIRILIDDPNAFKIWLLLQPLLGIFFYLTFYNRRFADRNKKGDIGGPQAVGNGEYGTAKWATKKELDQTATIWKFGQEEIKGGILMGTNLIKKYIWTVVEDVHTLIIGSTRSGKSRRWVFPTIWRLGYAGESMVLTDPKGELYARSKKFLETKGYDVICIDFRNGYFGNFWNPMHQVNKAMAKGNFTEASKMASSIAHMFVHQSPDSKRGEQTWNNGAESVLTSLILAIANDAPKERFKHLTSVYRTLGELGEPEQVIIGNRVEEFVPLNEYMKSLDVYHPAKDAFMAARIATDRMRGSFFSQVLTLLKNFSDPTMQYLTSQQDHELENIGKKKTAVFLVIPDEDTTRHVLASLYVEQTYQALVKAADEHDGRLPVRVNMILDEFGNMPPIKDFDTKLTVSGGRGIRWHLIVQDFQQLEKNYGTATDTIKGNCHTWIYILTASMKTAKELSERLGNYTIRTEGGSVTDNKNVSYSSNYGKAARRLLTEDELLKIPENKAIIFRLRRDPAFVDYPDLSFYPADQELTKEELPKRSIEKVSFFVPTKKYHFNHGEAEPAEASSKSTENSQYSDDISDDIEKLLKKFDEQMSMDHLLEDEVKQAASQEKEEKILDEITNKTESHESSEFYEMFKQVSNSLKRNNNNDDQEVKRDKQTTISEEDIYI